MNKKKGTFSSKNTAAVISIGSESIKMDIACVRSQRVSIVDRLEYPVNLGHEVFNDSRLTFESVKEISRIIEGFQQVMREYGVTQYKAVATSVFREAENREFVIDQLKIRNDVNIEVYSMDKAKSLIISEIVSDIKGGNSELSNTLISYLGTGSIGISTYRDGVMNYTRSFPIGSMKLTEILNSEDSDLSEYYDALDEYIDSSLDRVIYSSLDKSINKVIVAGSMVSTIAKCCGVSAVDGYFKIKQQQIEAFYSEIRKMPLESIHERFGISVIDAELLYTAVAFYIHILRLTKANSIVAVNTQLADALMSQLLLKNSKTEYEKHIAQSAASCARSLAKYYKCDSNHYERVTEYALAIFDKLKKHHGLNAKRRLILELACILHESGCIMNAQNSLLATYDIILNTDFYGLSKEDAVFIAATACCDEFNIGFENDSIASLLSQKNKLIVTKLSAIFRVANALDKSQKQKLKSFALKFKDDELVISVETEQNVYLEKWAFEECRGLFEDVFGIKLRLVIKSPYLK